MIGYCFRGEISEVKQCFHFGTFRHLEHWVLVSKKVKELLKGYFFETCQWILFWKSGTTFCISTKPQGIFPSHKRKFFCPWEEQKSMASFDDVTKTVFLLNIPKHPYFAQFHRQSVEQDQSDNQQTWQGGVWHVWLCKFQYWNFWISF